MKLSGFASGDRGSMLPLFLGLIAVSLVLCFGIAEFGSMFIFRQQIQSTADQVALKSSFSNLTSQVQVSELVARQNSKLYLTQFQVLDGQTVELKICAEWQGWFRLPGLDSKAQLCATSASR